MRCFVAIPVPDAVGAALARAQVVLRTAAPRAEVRWAGRGGFHVTLKFLGNVKPERLAEVEAALRRAAGNAVALSLVARGLGGFPSSRRPRIVWAGIVPHEGLTTLVARLEAMLAPLGFPPEGKPFHAHVTLGRIRAAGAAGGLTRTIALEIDRDLGAWTAAELVLYRSELKPGGAEYHPLVRVPLRAG